jgi:hypothetical protein
LARIIFCATVTGTKGSVYLIGADRIFRTEVFEMRKLMARFSLLIFSVAFLISFIQRVPAFGAPRQTTASPQDQILVIGVVTLTQVSAGQETSASATTDPDKYAAIPALQVVRVPIHASALQNEATGSPQGVASLKGVVVNMGDGQKQPADGPLLRKVPVEAVQLVFDVFLSDQPETPVAHGTVPVERAGLTSSGGYGTSAPPPTIPTESPTDATPGGRTPASQQVPGPTANNPAALLSTTSNIPTITMPPLVIAGGVQVMHGQISGNSSEIKILVDDQAARVVAAKPGTVLWDVPKTLVPGPHRVVVWAGPGFQPVEFIVHVLGLRMSADATTLLRGQSTAIHVMITGLEDLPESAWASAVPPGELIDLAGLTKRIPGLRLPQSGEPGAVILVLENRSPTTVRMGKRGDYIVLIYHKKDMVNGARNYDDKLQSLQSGGFDIEGIVAAFLGLITGQAQHQN